MDSTTAEVLYFFPPFLRVYTDGRVERLAGTDVVPPSINSETGVSTKDVVIAPETGVSARLFKPISVNPEKRLPLLVYFHGGGFSLCSPYCSMYHNYITSLVLAGQIIAVSVDYRLAPENPLPAAYEDSWTALQWAVSHSNGQGSEPWLNDHADFQRVFLAGDSAGGNISHNLAVQAGVDSLGGGVKLRGICLIHPYFWRKSEHDVGKVDGNISGGRPEEIPGVDNRWLYVYPTTSGFNDRRMNPAADERLWRLGCDKVLVCVAEKDVLRERGWFYYETLGKSGWNGEAVIMETEGEKHVFHLFEPSSERAVNLMTRIVSFINQEFVEDGSVSGLLLNHY